MAAVSATLVTRRHGQARCVVPAGEGAGSSVCHPLFLRPCLAAQASCFAFMNDRKQPGPDTVAWGHSVACDTSPHQNNAQWKKGPWKTWKTGACVSVCAGGGVGLYYFIQWAVNAS